MNVGNGFYLKNRELFIDRKLFSLLAGTIGVMDFMANRPDAGIRNTNRYWKRSCLQNQRMKNYRNGFGN